MGIAPRTLPSRAAALLAAALSALSCAAPAAVPRLPPARAEDPWSPSRPPAEDRAEPTWEERHGFHATLTPYAWRAGAKGDLKVQGLESSFDEGDAPEITKGGRIEVASEGVAIFLDGFYTTIEDRVSGVEVDARYFALDFGAAMRILGLPPSVPPEKRPAFGLDLDGLAFVRTHVVNMETDPSVAALTTTDSALWLDLVLGLRGEAALLGRLSAFGRIDGGGMGTRIYRSYSWSADAGVRLRVTRNLGAVAGYRWYRVHLEDDLGDDDDEAPFGALGSRSSLDARLTGPWAGLVVEF
jgi:hypothetical protein